MSPCSSPRIIRSLSSSNIRASVTIPDSAAWYCSIIIVSLILVITLLRDTYPTPLDFDLVLNNATPTTTNSFNVKATRPCDEIYVVGEGETLHTISDKCHDPFIVERNPHIHDPDDVFPGLVIRILPTTS